MEGNKAIPRVFLVHTLFFWGGGVGSGGELYIVLLIAFFYRGRGRSPVFIYIYIQYPGNFWCVTTVFGRKGGASYIFLVYTQLFHTHASLSTILYWVFRGDKCF